jgi:hypothetical protein
MSETNSAPVFDSPADIGTKSSAGVPAGDAVNAEIERIEARMKSDRSRYMRGEVEQARYRQLVDQRDGRVLDEPPDTINTGYELDSKHPITSDAQPSADGDHGDATLESDADLPQSADRYDLHSVSHAIQTAEDRAVIDSIAAAAHNEGVGQRAFSEAIKWASNTKPDQVHAGRFVEAMKHSGISHGTAVRLLGAYARHAGNTYGGDIETKLIAAFRKQLSE